MKPLQSELSNFNFGLHDSNMYFFQQIAKSKLLVKRKLTGLNKRLLIIDTSSIHINTRIDVIKRITNTIKILEKRVIIDLLSVSANSIRMRMNIQLRIHLLRGQRSNSRLKLLNIVRSEEELSIQIGLFDSIHVGDDDLPAIGSGTKTDHGEILEVLASECSGAH